FNKGANSYGFKELLGIQPVGDIGKLKALIVFGDDMPEALPVVDFLAVIGTRSTKNTENADIVLPASTFVESSGTFAPSAGKLLKVNKVIEPKYGPENWQVIQMMSTALDENAHRFSNPAEIYDELTAQ
ncbi:MAG TPA: molybdopterin-dependent oxidoreductase, partial [Clostridia bacterium]|nr:molybdopterin-dependent oxidoreductase [Clostridia bacterium]